MTDPDSVHEGGRRGVAVLLAMAFVLVAGDARATTFFEVYVGKRPADADEYMVPFYRMLAEEFHMVTPELIVRDFKYRPRPGVQDPRITAAQMIDLIESGYRAAARMEYKAAIETLNAALALVTANPGTFVADQNARMYMNRALVQLGLSYYALGEVGKGADAFADLARALDGQPLKGFSDAAQQRYNAASAVLTKLPPGKVLISVSEPDAQITLDEIGVGRGGTYSAGKLPGPYRALIAVKDRALAYDFEVQPGGERKLDIDWEFETTLVVTARWIGLELPSPPTQLRLLQYIHRLALRSTHETSVATLTLTQNCGQLGLTARRYQRRRVLEPEKVGYVLLDPADPKPAMRALLKYIVKNERSPVLQVGERPADCDVKRAEPTSDQPMRSNHPVMKWTGIGLLGVGLAAGGLAVKFALDAGATGDELQRVCAVTCTPDAARTLQDKQQSENRKAVISGVAGGVLVLGGGVLYLLSRRTADASSHLSVIPTRGGAMATVGFEF